ncbi:peptidase M28 [Flavobacterium covae]|uniref:M20/M25/M40 family metallo-hydrolase n=1 Tax=Flavobacterium covae TaxID=2906076 RepID=A0ABW8PEC2_9FLAO|nr:MULTISPECIES: M20/M25/M40 family metallo-hydrolase [Flavobacterium]MCJ1805857.1 M20/M25/M40 family metallo-hydrolase [Flavobacterium covae]OWP81750.1 peptidase M28 [Flavobacterium covae]OXA82908.1 peptidase M28 [Flavobacterium columnare] [Flavobacterium columnare NBRC 100251 = ATCC 23463]POR23696.1 peptidase M28 [Flavobacterium columnare]
MNIYKLVGILLVSSFIKLNAQETEYQKEERIKKIIQFLASDENKGREPGTPEMENVMVFLEKEFKENKIKPFYKTYRDKLSDYHKPAYNIVGVIEGNDPDLKNEYVVIGAHYDHIGNATEVEGDIIANGANDNAVGTTAVLEVMRYFSEKKNNKRSIIFALFTAEEKGLLGSRHLAKKMKNAKIDIYFMFNFEMIGIPMNHKKMLVYMTGITKSNMAKKMNEYANEKWVGYLPIESRYQLFKASDNYPFYEEYHIPAHTISTFDFENYKFYHHVKDEYDKMNIQHIQKVTEKSKIVLEKMINATTKEIQLDEE